MPNNKETSESVSDLYGRQKKGQRAVNNTAGVNCEHDGSGLDLCAKTDADGHRMRFHSTLPATTPQSHVTTQAVNQIPATLISCYPVEVIVLN